MNPTATPTLVLMMAGALAAGAIGYALALKGPRWHGLGLAGALALYGFVAGGAVLSNTDPLYLGLAFLIIVPWLLGGFFARRQTGDMTEHG